MVFENRRYVIIPSSEIANVDFAQVLETSPITCRYSVEDTKTFVKYEGEQPSSISSIMTKSREYSHEEILEVLAAEEWTLQSVLP